MERYIMLLNWKNQIGKITILSTAMYRFSVIPIEFPMAVLTALEKKKFFFLICMETQKIPNNQSNVEKEYSWRNTARNVSKK